MTKQMDAGMAAGTVIISVDVGGTFTDVVLQNGTRRVTGKVLTDVVAPERGILLGVGQLLEREGIAADEVTLFLHGTTLATNALIERKGAVTALLTTDGFRDSIEIGYEDRFDQYDIFIEKARPLVPRALRLTVRERMLAGGHVGTPLDERGVLELADGLATRGVESVAIGFLHSYANPAHEQRARELIFQRRPDVAVTLSSEVCPEIREYERFTTATANAYVQPLMRRYLSGLDESLKARGFRCPVLLMTSGGGLTTIPTACDFPIRLVESGPAGGAILAVATARDMGLGNILSFDMGGTTAKICLIDGLQPQASRSFEVDRQYNYMKGSGLPIRIPVIDMVEIGAGGGSIAGIDDLRRLTVGPESAGSTPGPACYGRGGERPTVTDANLLLGKIDPVAFAAGTIALDPDRAQQAVMGAVGTGLSLPIEQASHGIAEMVEENMANAARRHAAESGKTIEERSLIAFGGSAPLHAARLAEKLGIADVIVPPHAGVGSAVGFLRAPVSFEVVRSHVVPLSGLDCAAFEAMLCEMSESALAVVRLGAPSGTVAESATVSMRYVGQGHEFEVPLPPRPFTEMARDALRQGFVERYIQLFGSEIPQQDLEIVDIALRAEAASLLTDLQGERSSPEPYKPEPHATRTAFDTATRRMTEMPAYDRARLVPGAKIEGPAIIYEAETTTIVTASFRAEIDISGAIRLRRKELPA